MAAGPLIGLRNPLLVSTNPSPSAFTLRRTSPFVPLTPSSPWNWICRV